MLTKIILVVYLLSGRGEAQILYTARFPNEEACQVEAKKYQKTGLQSYPIQSAQCAFDITQPPK